MFSSLGRVTISQMQLIASSMADVSFHRLSDFYTKRHGVPSPLAFRNKARIFG